MVALETIRTDDTPHTSSKEKAYMITFMIAIFVFLVLILLKFVFHPVFVNGSSMYPTLHSGQVVSTVTHFTMDDIGYDDIIVFKTDYGKHEYFIKRVVGRPGDTIKINKEGLFRNGEKVSDDFQHMETGYCTVVLGMDEFFVLGDNRNNSNDSRVFGPVKYDVITNIVKNY